MNMKRDAAIFAILLLLFAAAVVAQDDIGRHRSCSECGMDRKGYGYSRMLVLFQDGSEVGTCSLHCAVVEIDRAQGKAVKSIRVADRDSRTLIDAEKATWVVGGNKRGVMTADPKWAFATQTAADAFVKAHGGRIVSWADAFEAARAENR